MIPLIYLKFQAWYDFRTLKKLVGLHPAIFLMFTGVQKQQYFGRYHIFLNKSTEFYSEGLNFVFRIFHAFLENIGTAVGGMSTVEKVAVSTIRR